MISYQEALEIVLKQHKSFGHELIDLYEVSGRVLAEDIRAGRDYPPFHRVAMDGIAVSYKTLNAGGISFRSEGIQAAGSPQMILKDQANCLEVMTGAMLPENCDTVIPYEHLIQEGDSFTLLKPVRPEQNVHQRGSDLPEKGLLLAKNKRLHSGSVALLATEGYSKVPVAALPKVALISTGDELVPVNKAPLPHQIRTSNVPMIQAALKAWGIQAEVFHVLDNKAEVETLVKRIQKEYDVSLFFGGVSKGKFDYLPDAFSRQGIDQLFHRVAQRPGKPMWFGTSRNHIVFALPGNPISSWSCFQVYFMPWLKKSLGISTITGSGKAKFRKTFPKPLTLFQLVKRCPDTNQFQTVQNNGSGDLTSLHEAEGILILDAKEEGFEEGEKYRCITFE
jgi:molybdopterin molybdotransferase